MMYVFLILGFLLLIKGADYFVEASSSVARALRIPSIIIGLTIVAFGTSAPELSVSISASIAGNNDIALRDNQPAHVGFVMRCLIAQNCT